MNLIEILSIGGIAGAIAGAITSSIISHFSAKKRAKDTDLKRLEREIYGLLNLISFSFLMQYSELFNLKKNLQIRLDVLNAPEKMKIRNERIKVLQDFSPDFSMVIKFQHIGDLVSLISNRFPDYQINPAIFQSCYIANKKYTEMLSVFQKYGDMKRSIDKEENITEELMGFLMTNIPEYLKMLETYMSFIKKTQESLAELFTLIDKKQFKLGEPIKLWG
ncbi:hypothetical protein SDB69_06535 [Legionella pneumophila serogroup 1]|uniref:hypothetical protein n=1 Tax=Legionella pneumophila TaxID=446 RepID=UPI000E02356B|nr:hypothetical protein [Legionella pneumophila]MDW9049970.1 hypothetical protein [Legionella pneumophila]MDW9059249.1 hypothetical protein [Legionella pneumophila]MDW9074412.1 hypothetical protein [Legionella pneumophila]MDW9116715.1 hypothetical protein [Legionella pneumophila]STX71213.1 Uncharacterised protein [Legionella pneumophila]